MTDENDPLGDEEIIQSKIGTTYALLTDQEREFVDSIAAYDKEHRFTQVERVTLLIRHFPELYGPDKIYDLDRELLRHETIIEGADRCARIARGIFSTSIGTRYGAAIAERRAKLEETL